MVFLKMCIWCVLFGARFDSLLLWTCQSNHTLKPQKQRKKKYNRKVFLHSVIDIGTNQDDQKLINCY